jgi:hypothetical protein
MKKRSLELPPSLDETLGNLDQPEVAPAKLDKRTLANTGRAVQFNTRVPKSFKDEINALKERDDLKNDWQWLWVAKQAYEMLPADKRERLIKKAISEDPAMRKHPEWKQKRLQRA